MSLLDSMKVQKKRFIVITSKDLTEEDRQSFRNHGKLLEYDYHLINVNFETLEFDYLVCDIREKSHREALIKHDLTNYQIVCYVHFYEKAEDFVRQINERNPEANILTKIPKRSINRDDFEKTLLEEKLVSPSLVKQVLRVLFSCFLKQ
jgi:predicted kinase